MGLNNSDLNFSAKNSPEGSNKEKLQKNNFSKFSSNKGHKIEREKFILRGEFIFNF